MLDVLRESELSALNILSASAIYYHWSPSIPSENNQKTSCFLYFHEVSKENKDIKPVSPLSLFTVHFNPLNASFAFI